MKDSKKLQYSTLFKALWLGQSFPTKSHHSPPYPNQTASFRVDWRVSLLVLGYRTLAVVMVVPYPLGLSEVYGTIHRLWICFDHSHSFGCVVVPFPLQRNCSEAMNYHHLWVLQRERVSTRRNAEVRQADRHTIEGRQDENHTIWCNTKADLNILISGILWLMQLTGAEWNNGKYTSASSESQWPGKNLSMGNFAWSWWMV